ncbi:MAG: hypothetical protein IPM13_08375 [Phycisphaerales bacterium]|nr:hypothetical protein [Phycisphaerales bacterium]
MRNAALTTLAGCFLMASLALAAGGGGGNGVRVEGVITSINTEALQLVVAGTTIQVTPNTIIMKNGRAISFEQLAVGMTVAACGDLVEGTLLANRITVKYSGN